MAPSPSGTRAPGTVQGSANAVPAAQSRVRYRHAHSVRLTLVAHFRSRILDPRGCVGVCRACRRVCTHIRTCTRAYRGWSESDVYAVPGAASAPDCDSVRACLLLVLHCRVVRVVRQASVPLVPAGHCSAEPSPHLSLLAGGRPVTCRRPSE